MSLTKVELNDERKRLAPRYTSRKHNILGTAGALFEAWIFTEAAGRIDASKEWQDLIAASEIECVRAPEVICRVAAAEFKRNMPRWLAVHSVHWTSKMMSDLSNELREILAILVSDASDYVEGELIGMFA